jgi:hypothetical protein
LAADHRFSALATRRRAACIVLASFCELVFKFEILMRKSGNWQERTFFLSTYGF